MRQLIDITGVDLIKLVKKAYELSIPVGLGFLHFTPKPLSDEEAKSLIYPKDDFIIRMDYVKGRCCKFDVKQEKKRWYVINPWYDHTKEQLIELLKEVWPIDKPFPKLEDYEHGVSCMCLDCRGKV